MNFLKTDGDGGARMLICIIGAGGHGRVICEMVDRNSEMELIGFLDDEHFGGVVEGHPVIGTVEDASRLAERYAHLKFVIGIGDNSLRKQVACRLDVLEFASVVDPSAVISRSAIIDNGTVIMPQVIVNSRSTIGSHVILNSACTVDHDDIIESFVHISPGAHLAGGVTVGQGTHLGTGVSVIPGMEIGSWAVIGAGAVVVNNVGSDVVAFGVPARPHRRKE